MGLNLLGKLLTTGFFGKQLRSTTKLYVFNYNNPKRVSGQAVFQPNFTVTSPQRVPTSQFLFMPANHLLSANQWSHYPKRQ